jgi:hypothetical protein
MENGNQNGHVIIRFERRQQYEFEFCTTAPSQISVHVQVVIQKVIEFVVTILGIAEQSQCIRCQGNVDGEMGVHESHLVKESLGGLSNILSTCEHMLRTHASCSPVANHKSMRTEKLLSNPSLLVDSTNEMEIHVNKLEITS